MKKQDKIRRWKKSKKIDRCFNATKYKCTSIPDEPRIRKIAVLYFGCIALAVLAPIALIVGAVAGTSKKKTKK